MRFRTQHTPVGVAAATGAVGTAAATGVEGIGVEAVGVGAVWASASEPVCCSLLLPRHITADTTTVILITMTTDRMRTAMAIPTDIVALTIDTEAITRTVGITIGTAVTTLIVTTTIAD